MAAGMHMARVLMVAGIDIDAQDERQAVQTHHSGLAKTTGACCHSAKHASAVPECTRPQCTRMRMSQRCNKASKSTGKQTRWGKVFSRKTACCIWARGSNCGLQAPTQTSVSHTAIRTWTDVSG